MKDVDMSAALQMYIDQGQWEKAIETAAGQVIRDCSWTGNL